MTRVLRVALPAALIALLAVADVEPLFRVIPIGVYLAFTANRWLLRNGYTVGSLLRRSPRDY